MDRITRYLFILLLIVVFLVLAPLIVLYLSGTRFNLTSRDTEATGILVAKSNPSGAQVFIDGEEKDKTESTIRFLNRGDYNVRLTKDGYFPWSKRLAVESNKVTYTYEGLDAVELIRLPEPFTLTPQSVTSLVVVDDVIWFGTTNAVGHTGMSQPSEVKTISTPFTPRSLTILRNSNFLLADNGSGKKFLIDRGNDKIITLPDTLNLATDLNITSDNQLLARRSDIVYGYNFDTRVLSPLLHQVAGFTLLDNTAYVAHRDGALTIQTLRWNGIEFGDAEPILNSQLPGSKDVQLIITTGKELFAVSEGTLYRINGQPEVVSNHILAASLDFKTNELTFSTPSELWFYNFVASKPQLLTRTTSPINTFLLRSSIGYGLIATQAGLEALEIDVRDQQNRYTLLTDAPVWAVGLSDNQKNLAALQNSQIIILPIR